MAAGYRSAQGKTVDMSVLQKQNEQVRAVGNMNVNARGDLVDNNNQVIQNRNASVAGQYNRTVNHAVAKQFNPTLPTQSAIEPDLSQEERAMFEELDEPEAPFVEPVVETKAKKK